MDAPALLEVVAHGITAVLGVWLGLTVLTRSTAPPARVFALVTLTIALWSSSIIVERLSPLEDARTAARGIEEFLAALVIGATAHLSLAIATEGHPARRLLWVVLGLYVLNIAIATPILADPQTSPTRMAMSADLSAAVFGWSWVIVRLGSLVLGAAWLVRALRDVVPGSLRRRQLLAALATILVGGIGAALRILPGISDEEPWIGVSFVTLAILLATYAVLSAGIFFGPTVAGRAFRTSVVGGLALVALVGAILALDAIGRQVVGLDLPLLMAMSVVVLVAVYEPVAARVRPLLAGGGPRITSRDRLLRALGQADIAPRPAGEGVQPALHRLATVVGVTGLEVVRPDGTVAAREGDGGLPSTVAPIPLVAGGEVLGELRVGPSTSGLPLSERDEGLLQLSAAYVAAALRAGRREDEQAASLAGLVEERAAVDEQASTLHAALVQHTAGPVGLHIFALGPLRVERNGQRIERWGGDKAGTRQAEALFAFLFDRGERGVAKDDALEMIWPDVELERADLAFHRTMVGLRGTLDPGVPGRESRAIRFHNDRYRMEAAVIAWADTDEFLARLEAARSAPSPAERLALLEQARSLYRGEYLDDCPFFGDSEYVDQRRRLFRGHLVDLLIALGEGYEATGDRVSAAAAFREALVTAGDDCPPAKAGLSRLGT